MVDWSIEADSFPQNPSLLTLLAKAFLIADSSMLESVDFLNIVKDSFPERILNIQQ